jgi:hypothetical protein
MTPASISALENQIRGYINKQRVLHGLLQKPISWNQMCSSLDVIGDTELCFDAYEVCAPPPEEAGATYLLVYGVLQALMLQQDAVCHLAEALDVPYSLDPLLREVREVRNSSIGHPTKRFGEPRAHFISRISMRKGGFQLMTVYADHRPGEFKWVDIPELIASQRKQLSLVLSGVVSVLIEREREHRAMFKDKKLADAFHSSIDYDFEKLFECVHGNGSLPGGFHVKLVRDAVGRFKSALESRGSAGAYSSVDYHLRLIEYPLDELEQYFRSPQSSRLTERDAFIFVHFAQDQLEQLRQMASEIDDDYQSNQPEDTK